MAWFFKNDDPELGLRLVERISVAPVVDSIE